MKKIAAVFVSIGVILVIAGLVMVGIFGGEAIRNTDWKSVFSGTNHNLESAEKIKEYKPSDLEGLTKIDIKTDRYSVYVLPASTDDIDASIRYVTPLENTVTVDIEYVDGTLSIVETDDLGTAFFSSMFKSNRFVVVYLPQTELFTSAMLHVTAKTAGIKVQNVMLESMQCIAQTGSVYLSNVKANNVIAQTTTGSVTVDKLDCNQLSAQTTTGSVTVSNLTCNQLSAKTTTGSVTLTEITAEYSVNVQVETGTVNCDVTTRQIVVEADTGSVNFTTNASVIDITTDTGSINGTVLGNKSDYQIKVRKDTGKANLTSQSVPNAEKFLTVEVDTGSININFRND